jgi:hypothetical protein|nr:MAG TPA: Dna polymerase B [Caudoviricetes sp.]
MSVIRVEKTKNYTVMSNYHFKEKDMSLKAKGLLSLMLSLPNNWDYSIAGLVAICKENETAIKSALKELHQFGYVKVDKIMPDKTDSGRIEYIYNIYEKPKQDSKKQDVENLPLENQHVENHTQLSINKLSTNKLSTKDNIKKNTKKKSKIDIKIESIEKTCLEYDLTDEVIELLSRFFRNLLENHKMVTDDKVHAILTRLARVSTKTQINAIQLSLDNGYMNIDPDWLKVKTNSSNRLPQELILNGTTTDEGRENYRNLIKNNDPSIKHF